jgi:hypothetical protein
VNGIAIPNGYIFHPSASQSVSSWNWDFGDGTCPAGGAAACTSTGDTFHLFPSDTDYVITLTTTSFFGFQRVTHALIPMSKRRLAHH